jgi:hypothetical protein
METGLSFINVVIIDGSYKTPIVGVIANPGNLIKQKAAYKAALLITCQRVRSGFLYFTQWAI